MSIDLLKNTINGRAINMPFKDQPPGTLVDGTNAYNSFKGSFFISSTSNPVTIQGTSPIFEFPQIPDGLDLSYRPNTLFLKVVISSTDANNVYTTRYNEVLITGNPLATTSDTELTSVSIVEILDTSFNPFGYTPASSLDWTQSIKYSVVNKSFSFSLFPNKSLTEIVKGIYYLF
jgi:hypothetical protein